jgi:hypothetical protein
MGNFPYQTHFNEIAKEERELGYAERFPKDVVDAARERLRKYNIPLPS